jgi:hypothetical protein
VHKTTVVPLHGLCTSTIEKFLRRILASSPKIIHWCWVQSFTSYKEWYEVFYPMWRDRERLTEVESQGKILNKHEIRRCNILESGFLGERKWLQSKGGFICFPLSYYEA